MTLLKVVSERKDENGVPYLDLYLAWKHDNKAHLVRVRPAFRVDYKRLVSQATECETVENFEKYL